MTIRFYSLLLLLPVFLYGCSKVTSQNYNQLKAGMSYQAVIDILGTPESCSEQFKAQSCLWGNEKKYIRGTFVAEKLVLYSSEGLE